MAARVPIDVAFALRFGVALAAFRLAIVWPLSAVGLRDGMCRGLAWTAAAALRTVGREARSIGHGVALDGFSVSVTHDCDGLLLAGVYAAAVLATRGSLRARRLSAALPGLALLLLLNALRIPALVAIGAHDGAWFAIAHERVFQWGSLLVLLLAWGRWATRIPIDSGSNRHVDRHREPR